MEVVGGVNQVKGVVGMCLPGNKRARSGEGQSLEALVGTLE